MSRFGSLCTVLMLTFGFPSFAQNKSATESHAKVTVTLGGKPFKLEVAYSSEEKKRGLTNRPSLGPRQGMIFWEDRDGFRPIWTKDCRFPIDVLWVSSKNQIVWVQKNIPPCHGDDCPQYNSIVKFKYILELKAGAIDDAGVKLGDRIDISTK